MKDLSILFHSEVRAAVFRLLFGAETGRRYRAEIIAQTDFAAASVEEELEKLVHLGLLVSSRDGNRRYFTANREHLLFPEIQGIVQKSTGQQKPRRRPATPAATRPVRPATEPPKNVIHTEEPNPETDLYLR